ncbi:response regulator [Halomicrobium salinisoli]|uniref:response regulator n=1 Tax=Halomicrobium salinisoli TaxID=2878391 RepID=UPI001CF05F65|nr:response regulator [Halomicrobium salinisoli]
MSSVDVFGDVLLVEDNPGDVRLTREMLQDGELDPTIHAVTDGPEALSFLRQRGEYDDAPRPDLILLDLHLARMDGDEVLEMMTDDVRDVPVVAISGSQEGAALKLDDVEDRVAACLVKPIEPDDLLDVARTL